MRRKEFENASSVVHLSSGARAGERSRRLPFPLLLILLSGCQPAVLDPAGPVGIAERTILINSLAIMLAIAVPTIGSALAFGWWFRAGNARARYLPHWAYSGRVELVVWAVPLLTIMLLGGVSWVGSHDLDPAKPLESEHPALEIQVVSLDWKWLFIYPDQRVALVNQLVIPAGVPVHFTLTSSSVMNTFFIPRLGSMIYTMNGMQSQLHLLADQPGEFDGLSGHFSGDGFSDMRFTVRALGREEFAAWQHTPPGTERLDDASYAILARQSSKVAPGGYRDLAPGLFDRIVNQQIAPAAGPRKQ